MGKDVRGSLKNKSHFVPIFSPCLFVVEQKARKKKAVTGGTTEWSGKDNRTLRLARCRRRVRQSGRANLCDVTQAVANQRPQQRMKKGCAERKRLVQAFNCFFFLRHELPSHSRGALHCALKLFVSTQCYDSVSTDALHIRIGGA